MAGDLRASIANARNDADLATVGIVVNEGSFAPLRDGRRQDLGLPPCFEKRHAGGMSADERT